MVMALLLSDQPALGQRRALAVSDDVMVEYPHIDQASASFSLSVRRISDWLGSGGPLGWL